MRTILVAAIALLPAAGNASTLPVCDSWDGRKVAPQELRKMDVRCSYSTKALPDGRLQVIIKEGEPNPYAAILAPKAPARPAVRPEVLEAMRLDMERRQRELDRLERVRRDRANRELGYFLLNQALRQPVYVAPPPVNLQERNTHLLLQEYLRKELARQRRERLLGPYD